MSTAGARSVDLIAAHRHSSGHGDEVRASVLCGCFYCLTTFARVAVEEWLSDKGDTALCPTCRVDAVIGDRSGYPITDGRFLRDMHNQWFGT